MIFQKILVPLDGSDHSRRALESAIQIAKSFNSKLMLLTVHHVTITPVTSPELTIQAPVIVPDASAAEMTERAIEAAHNYDKKILAEAEAKVRSEKIEVESELIDGNAVEEIVRKSEEGKFDLIIMGARGLSTIKKLFIGSVSDGVIKKAPCPVLIVK
jgi:nucleotide-binding universal stress UspA family protein